jgi:MYXO-CTERM domain-containing protein
MSVLTKLSLVSVVAATAVATSASAALLAGWTITTAFPTGTGNVPTGLTYSVGAANDGLQTAGSQLRSVHALAAATYTSPAGNGSQYSFSSNNWSTGDFYEARLSTLGYSDISISWDQARSSTGPATFELVMSTDGGANFTTLLASYAVLQSGGGGSPGTWSSTVYNPIYSLNQAAAAADNQADVIFRFRSLVAGAATGSNRIDNVMIYSGPIPAPGAIALLGVAGLAGLRRRR